jgi:hypothetical protein
MTFTKKGKSVIEKYPNTKLFKKIQARSEAIAADPLFRKEYRAIKKECRVVFYPHLEREVKTDEDFNVYFEKRKIYQSFLDKWNIRRVLNNRPWVKSPVEICLDEKNIPDVRPVSKEIVAQDIIDSVPFIIALKNHHLGRATETRGRKTETERNAEIRAEFNRRKKHEKSKDIINSIASREYLSPAAVSKIVYSKQPTP